MPNGWIIWEGAPKGFEYQVRASSGSARFKKYIYVCVCVCVCIKYIATSPKNCYIIVLLATQAIKLMTSSGKTNRAYFFKLQELITLI